MSSVFDNTTCFKLTFDKPIVSNPLIALPLGTPTIMTISALAVSSTYSTNYATNALDKNIYTCWTTEAVVGEWFAVAYRGKRYMNKIRMYSSSRRIKDFAVQYSDDNINWTTTYTGLVTDTSTWQEFAIDCATPHEYWRVYAISGYASNIRIYEIEFYCTRQMYSANGFTVSGRVYDRSPGSDENPGGDSSEHTYTIRKITKSADNLSIFIWLDIFDRLKYPLTVVTISYNKAIGNLAGTLSSQVESFTEIFMPTGYAITMNPHDVEHIGATVTAQLSQMQVIYTNAKEDENIAAQITVSATLYHINDIPT